MKMFKYSFFVLTLFVGAASLLSSCGTDDPTDPPTCFDNIQNQDETGVDCGGVCAPCPTCTDGIENGDETGVDCGGDCAPCPTCTDGVQNGDETGVDCGGSCNPCPFTEFMTATIDGVPFEANLVAGFDNLTTLEFQSDQSQDRQLFFVLPSGTGEGTYELVNNPGFSAEYKKLFDGEFTTQSGTITITENNTGQAELSGTFEFIAVEFDFGTPVDTVVITDGAFGVEYF